MRVESESRGSSPSHAGRVRVTRVESESRGLKTLYIIICQGSKLSEKILDIRASISSILLNQRFISKNNITDLILFLINLSHEIERLYGVIFFQFENVDKKINC